MTDDAKEWVTVKIPKRIRDEAREDARTYGQIIQAGLENEPFAENESVNVEALADELRETITDTDVSTQTDAEELAREVARQIDYVEVSNRVADELEGRMG